MQPIDVSPTKLETVREILGQHVPELEVRAFGSRVDWTARETSDLDLVLMTDAPFDIGQIVALKGRFHQIQPALSRGHCGLGEHVRELSEGDRERPCGANGRQSGKRVG